MLKDKYKQRGAEKGVRDLSKVPQKGVRGVLVSWQMGFILSNKSKLQALMKRWPDLSFFRGVG